MPGKSWVNSTRPSPTIPRSSGSTGRASSPPPGSRSAIADDTEAIRLDPRLVAALANRGSALHLKGEVDRALDDLDEAIRLDPSQSKSFECRARLCWAKGEWSGAVADMSKVIRLEPKLASAYSARGRIFVWIPDHDKAIADFDQAIRLDPNDSNVYRDRGWVREERGEPEKALADYNEAIRLDPSNANAHCSRAWIRATCRDDRLRDGKKALESAVRACELSHDQDAEILSTLAAAHAEAGEFEQAVQREREAIELMKDAGRRQAQQARLELYLDKKPYHELPPPAES
jgi:tetratricopeptide (TPR) repeat protein